MLERIQELLLHPDAFFAQVTREEANLTPPIAIVGIAGVFDCISLVILLLTAGDYLVLALPIVIPSSLVMPYIIWVIFTAVLYGISRAFSGTGTFRATLQNVGYGMLPWAVSRIFHLLLTITITWNAAYYRSLEGMRSLVSLGGMQIVFIILDFVLMVWTGYLWFQGIKHTHQLPQKKAAIAVVSLLILYYLVTLVPVLLMYAMSGGLTGYMNPGY